MAFVNKIPIAMIVAMAIDNALAIATAVVIGLSCHDKNVICMFFCFRLRHGYCFVHSSGSGYR